VHGVALKSLNNSDGIHSSVLIWSIHKKWQLANPVFTVKIKSWWSNHDNYRFSVFCVLVSSLYRIQNTTGKRCCFTPLLHTMKSKTRFSLWRTHSDL
jgi:hypothetical protein